MTDRDRERELDRLTARFLAALDSGDLDAAYRLWNEAAGDQEVATALTEAASELVGEAAAVARAEADGIVEAVLRRSVPTLETIRLPSGPLTVGDVAEHLRRSGVPGLTAAELAVNDVLARSADSLPEQLGLTALTAWGAQFGSAPKAFWKAFREAAIELRLRRESADDYRLAARPQRPKRPGGNQ